jgi:hypothetical protein
MRTVDGVEILTEQEKQALIVATIKERGLTVFIETGTYQGDTLAAVLAACVPPIEQAMSCELHPENYVHCLERFHRQHVWGESSETWLPKMLAQTDEPALIWLDAHHSDADSAGTHDTCPLRAELKACLASTLNHVIFCDDARFLGRGNWPTLAEIHEMATGWNVQVADDIVRITR